MSSPAVPKLSELSVRIANAHQVDLFHAGLAPAAGAVVREIMVSPTYLNGLGILWVLVKIGEEEGEIYSWLQTIRRRVLVRDPKTTPKGQVEEEWMYTVQFVQTAEKYRQHGYAHRLLRIIHYILAPSQNLPPMPKEFGTLPVVSRDLVPYCRGSHLSTSQPPGFYESCYVGDESYGRQGWVSTDDDMNTAINWDIPTILPAAPSKPHDLDWEYVYEKDFGALGPRISEHYRAGLAGQETDGETVLVLPDPGQEGWLAHFEMWTHYNTRHSHSKHPPPFNATHPLVLFVPGALVRRPDLLPITITMNVNATLLPQILDVCTRVAWDVGASRLQAWGVDVGDALTKRWIELGGKVESRVVTRQDPFGWCWYGPEGSRGKLMGCEMWTES